MEPASLALGVIGLTSLFDGCLRLYEHVSNARRYPEDCKRQVLFMDLEKSRFELIRTELLQDVVDPKAALVMDDETVDVSGLQLNCNTSEQPPPSPGVWKNEYLGRLLHSVQGVLTEAQAIVEKYQKTDSKRKLRNFISSRLHTNQLSWIADDKRRLKELVDTLRQLNSYIEQLLPATSRRRLQLGFGATVVLSADMSQLQDIQAESSSVGYDDLHQGAAVRIAKLSIESEPSNAQHTTQDFRIYNPCIQLRRLIDKSSNVYSSGVYETGSPGRLSRKSVLLERRQAFTTVDSIGAAERRLNSLVSALRSMKVPATKPSQGDLTVASDPVDFGVPRCLGWIAPESSDLDVIELVYEYPDAASQTPRSLHTLLQSLVSADRPSLGARFDLALHLAHFYASFISVGYLHKGLHSHNVLFFDDTLRPYIVGCAESRPETAPQYSSPLSDAIADRELYLPWETIMGMAETDPSKRTRWSAAVDIYGLGVMLVEIGRWTCASQAWRTASLYDFHLKMDEFGSGSEIGVWQNYSDKVLKRLELCRA